MQEQKAEKLTAAKSVSIGTKEMILHNRERSDSYTRQRKNQSDTQSKELKFRSSLFKGWRVKGRALAGQGSALQSGQSPCGSGQRPAVGAKPLRVGAEPLKLKIHKMYSS